MSQPEDTDLQLLLTDSEELVPILESGLPESALGELRQPSRAGGEHEAAAIADAHDPDDLATQRWAVIVPEGEAGARLIDAIAALIDHRRAQQGAPPQIFRVPPAMDTDAALRWRARHLNDPTLPAADRPRYLLILGDLHEVSLELQQALACEARVGRLHCPTIKGFRDYAEKVVTRERAEPTAGRALFYTVQDGTAAIQAGYDRLVDPCMKMTQAWIRGGGPEIAGVDEIPYSDWGPDDMLAQVGVDTPSVLLSLSHGLGAPKKGWRSPEHQRAQQGALSMGLEKPLTADAVAKAPFLPGGVWFCLASFAAGTPDASTFAPWLERIAERGGHRQAAKDVLRSLPAAGTRPFVAALPQALLANPRGPLAIVGHVDLAWTFGFADPIHERSRASRSFASLQALLAGRRVGVAIDALMHGFRDLDAELASNDRARRDALARDEPDPIAPRAHGRLWMHHSDLRGHLLLGDPAARVAVKSHRLASQERSPSPTPTRPAAAAPPPASEPGLPAPSPSPPSPRAEPPAPPIAPPPDIPAPAPTPPRDPPRTPEAPAERPPLATPAAVAPTLAAPQEPLAPPAPPAEPLAAAPSPSSAPPRHEVPMSTPQTPPPAHPSDLSHAPVASPTAPPAHSPFPAHSSAPPPAPPHPSSYPAHSYAPPPGAAPLGAMVRPRTLENPEIALRERAVLAMLRGDEAPRSIAVRFGLPLEEVFYWLDVYREAGRKALGG